MNRAQLISAEYAQSITTRPLLRSHFTLPPKPQVEIPLLTEEGRAKKSARFAQALACFEQFGDMTASELAGRMGVSSAQATKVLKRLTLHNRVQVVREKAPRKWKVLP